MISSPTAPPLQERALSSEQAKALRGVEAAVRLGLSAFSAVVLSQLSGVPEPEAERLLRELHSLSPKELECHVQRHCPDCGGLLSWRAGGSRSYTLRCSTCAREHAAGEVPSQNLYAPRGPLTSPVLVPFSVGGPRRRPSALAQKHASRSSCENGLL